MMQRSSSPVRTTAQTLAKSKCAIHTVVYFLYRWGVQMQKQRSSQPCAGCNLEQPLENLQNLNQMLVLMCKDEVKWIVKLALGETIVEFVNLPCSSCSCRSLDSSPFSLVTLLWQFRVLLTLFACSVA